MPRLRPEDMTAEQRAAVAAVRARNRTPEARAELEAERAAVRRDFPPADAPAADPDLAAAVAAMRRERERQGLSLTDVSERTTLDRATISKLETGRLANPTVATLRSYARALGKRVTWVLADAPKGGA